MTAALGHPGNELVVVQKGAHVAPPGYYLMFVNATAARIPSLGAFVRVM